jgi:two-component sensor histidine kinase
MKGKLATIPVHCSAATMHDAVGQPDGIVCAATNISRQKEAEERIRASLNEKELLLKEVHHRVKNNLQVICSLLSLQAQGLEDAKTIRLFEESQGRVRSMALLHEQLCLSNDLARIDFAAYVNELIGHIRRSSNRRNDPVAMTIEIQSFALPLDLAVPCGMIVNELVSNALEHAFPDGRVGQIRIGLVRDATGYCLTVADDGVGMPATLDNGEITTVGLKVVHALTRQIGGRLEIQHDQGTVFSLRFANSAEASWHQSTP